MTYDYAIIGAGAAGLNLALKMLEDPYFKEKTIIILEKDGKDSNDRTWCFWEKGESVWDQLATHTWEKGQFINSERAYSFELNPYRYKMLRSSDFYAYAKQAIAKHDHVQWITEEVVEIKNQAIHTKQSVYSASHIFDSTIPQKFFEKRDDYHSLIQHFKGWYIQTKNPVFDPHSFTMMDYRLKWKESASFTYVLPLSETRALVEFTLFNDELLPDDEYDVFLKKYIADYLHLDQYNIEEVEQGVIPMSDYPFHQHHEKHVTKIGTAGGWVRPSSGYSFKNADRYAAKVIHNIKSGISPEKGIARNRFRWYDSIFLNVLSARNDLGEEIFTRIYTKPEIQSVFRFLDEESNILEDIQVMFSLNSPQFWKAFLATMGRK